MTALNDARRQTALPPEMRQHVERIVAHLDHLLPGQAPILDFVHHNPLHGYQHLPFEQALAEMERITGIRAYLSEAEFRHYYAGQRIDDEDLDAALNSAGDLEPDTVLLESGATKVYRRDLYRLAMIYGIEATTPEELRWASQECGVFEGIMHDIPPTARHRLLQAIKMQTTPSAAHVPAPNTFVRALWNACTEKLGLSPAGVLPEDLLEPSPADEVIWTRDELALAEDPSSAPSTQAPDRNAAAGSTVDETFDRVGDEFSFPALLGELTGRNGLEAVRPELVRVCAAFLDEGVAAWQLPNRASGFYVLWRLSAGHGPSFEGMRVTPPKLDELPDDPTAALAAELARIGLPEERWEGYLRGIALELPGWCGLMNWRAHRSGYPANRAGPTSLIDLLAVRLILDRLWSESLCRDIWGTAATLPALRHHFRGHPIEFSVRRALFRGELPEFLAAAAHRLIGIATPNRQTLRSWHEFEQRHRAWQGRRGSSPAQYHTVHRSVWRLFRLAQHLGLTAPELSTLPVAQVERLLRMLDEFTPKRRVQLWLHAYERHYRQQILRALADNHARGRWLSRDPPPHAQLVFCMDDREESLRRHLEELNPSVETLGAAGFFGIPLYWQALDDERTTPLCPVVVTPSNEVHEVPRSGQAKRYRAHRRRNRLKNLWSAMLQHELRRNVLSSLVLIDLLAPAYLLGWAGKIMFPRPLKQWQRAIGSAFVPAVRTTLALTAATDSTIANPEKPRLGFTDVEQTDHVAAFLRNIGLVDGFAPLVVLMGHGSSSENNPHRAAYDCGACSGRHGGPNARVFAAMANRAEIRRRLAERDIRIPDSTWFVGTEHDTCSETITWYDLDDLPPMLRPVQHNLNKELQHAGSLSAHERCRRFASAPRKASLEQARNHVAGRSADFSQARPELGHATNAAAFVGRRAMSQGVFFDRRVFLISYDPTRDMDGSLLEGLLLAVGPVNAGINLEYYFSTVASDRLGCGSKVLHNVTGFFGIMEGASSDLRTGLPRQMTEIHEAMRLLLVVEQTIDVLTAIYQRQSPLRELIGNGWVQLASKHPDSGAIALFDTASGFVPWQSPPSQTPVCAVSAEWYAGHTGPTPPALIRPEAGPYREPPHA